MPRSAALMVHSILISKLGIIVSSFLYGNARIDYCAVCVMVISRPDMQILLTTETILNADNPEPLTFYY